MFHRELATINGPPCLDDNLLHQRSWLVTATLLFASL